MFFVLPLRGVGWILVIQDITEIGFVAALLRPQTEIEKDEIAPGNTKLN